MTWLTGSVLPDDCTPVEVGSIPSTVHFKAHQQGRDVLMMIPLICDVHCPVHVFWVGG